MTLPSPARCPAAHRPLLKAAQRDGQSPENSAGPGQTNYTGLEDKLRKLGLTVAMSLLLAVTLAMTGAAAPRAEAQNASDTDPASLVNLNAQYKFIGVFMTWSGELDIPAGYDVVAHRSHVSGPCPCETVNPTILVDANSKQPVAVLDKRPVSGATYLYWLTLTPNPYDDELPPGDLAASNALTYYVSPKPHNLTALTASSQGVMLRWTMGAHPKYTKQIVRRRAAGSSTWTEFEIGAMEDRYTDRTAESGVKYSYRVKAEKPNGKGGQTNRVKVTAP